MVVKWRYPPEKKYIDFEEIHAKIEKAFAGDVSHGWVFVCPNIDFRFNPTVPVPTIFEFLTSLVNQMNNRWEFKVYKVDEWVEVSTTHAYYQTITKQKHDLVRQVKEGLAHVDRAISDVELLAHDARRYKEILRYFAEKDEHSLKAMFIDLVDVNLPEGVSLRSIAPRWPTIIADFQELKDEDDTQDKIMKKIEVSKAEAVVLATKVRLYKKWKEFFGGEVKDRYRRILERLEGRKASIEEYRNWIRPMIRRVLMMREVDDKTLMMHMNFPAGAGMPYSLQYIEYWAFSRFEGAEPTEPHKIEREVYETKGVKIGRRGWAKVGEKAVPRFRVEPYDDVVKMFIPEIEKRHGVKLTKDDVLEARRRLFQWGTPGVEVYAFIKIPVSVETFKTRTGLEIEDVDFNKLSVYFMTHNILLIKILEMIAEEKKLDVYIDELLGKKVLAEGGIIKEVDELLREQYPEIYGPIEEEKTGFADFTSSVRGGFRSILGGFYSIFGLKLGFVKTGPYDPMSWPRIFYTYMRPFIRDIFRRRIWAFFMRSFGGM